MVVGLGLNTDRYLHIGAQENHRDRVPRRLASELGAQGLRYAIHKPIYSEAKFVFVERKTAWKTDIKV